MERSVMLEINDILLFSWGPTSRLPQAQVYSPAHKIAVIDITCSE
jgi:hypothetical protein